MELKNFNKPKLFQKILCIALLSLVVITASHAQNNKLATYTPAIISYLLNEDVGLLKTLGLTSTIGTFYPKFDPQIKHYAASCGNGDNVLVSASALNDGTGIFINDVLINTGTLELQGLSYDSDIVVELRNGTEFERYYIHCISSDFPQMDIVTKTSDVDEGFILVAPRFSIGGITKTWLLVIDNNGVPRFRRLVEGIANNFNYQVNGQFTYVQRLSTTNTFGRPNNENVILNSEFVEVDRVTTVNLNHTDSHDFLVTPSNTFIQLSYNSIFRDFTPYGLSDNQLTRDSIIQEISAEGDVIFEWNSWDHMNVNDCRNHRFPDDYAHINSIQIAPDGNLIASFRGCSQIFKIDRITGETIWSLGGMEPTLEISGDPFNEFCGQHTATEDNLGNLYIFDNGGHCNGTRESEFGQFSRALKYHLDLESFKAVFIKDYSLGNTYSEYTRSLGSVYLTNNGDWLINWGRGPDTTITEVSEAGKVALEIRMHFNGVPAINYRAYRVSDLLLPINSP